MNINLIQKLETAQLSNIQTAIATALVLSINKLEKIEQWGTKEKTLHKQHEEDLERMIK